MTMRRMVLLSVRSRDNVDRLAELVWESGIVQIRYATEKLRVAIARWIQHGLVDMSGARFDPELRHTGSDDPRFLEHLNSYLKRSSGFITHIEIHDRITASWLFAMNPGAPPPSATNSKHATEKYKVKDKKLQDWTMKTLANARRALGPANG